MTTLTIHHLAPYLPYGLKVINEKSGKIIEVTGLRIDPCEIVVISQRKNYGLYIWPLKPILRPLSDVSKYTKEIDGIMPGYSLNEHLDIVMPDGSVVGFKEFVPLYSFLCSKHIDLFALIPANLAVDVNNLTI